MIRTFLILALLVFVALTSAPTFAAPDSQGFVEVVQPFFKKYCVQCHGADTQEGGIDQVAARQLGVETRFPSLELSGTTEGGGYGPGLSLSWSEAGNPIAGETSPVALFDRLFGAAEVPLEKRKYLLSKQRSVLDAVLSDARRTLED